LACALALGGCGGGVEFQGKVFDYMGLSGDRQKPDARMSERAPLLLPPNLKTLPPPGTGVAVATAREDWPDDPEKVRKRVVAEQKKKEAEEEAAADPTNPYAGKPTLLDKLFGKSRVEEEPIADVPEPDPSLDKGPEDSTSSTVAARPQPLTPHVPQEAPPAEDPFNPAAPDSYGRMSRPTGNQAPW
jgi:hypothetical protein